MWLSVIGLEAGSIAAGREVGDRQKLGGAERGIIVGMKEGGAGEATMGGVYR